MKATVNGTYRTTLWREQDYARVSSAPRLAVAEKEIALEGDLRGKGVLRYSIVYVSEGQSTFTGYVRLTGQLDGREGTFVVEDSGKGTHEKADATWRVVEGSGTGDLAGLRGGGTWHWDTGIDAVCFTLTYEL